MKLQCRNSNLSKKINPGYSTNKKIYIGNTNNLILHTDTHQHLYRQTQIMPFKIV